MRAKTRRAGRVLAAALGAATLAGGAHAVQAATFQVVHDFADGTVCSDVCNNPGTPKLAADPYGAVYGAYPTGGAKGKGTVWKLEPPVTRGGVWKFSVLHTFDGTDDSGPVEVQRASSGTLFVGTLSGRIWAIAPGTHALSLVASLGSGAVDFTLDPNGRIVGLTGNGGAAGRGTLFQVIRSHGTWVTQTLHTFGPTDPLGSQPHRVTTGPDGTAYIATRANTVLAKPPSANSAKLLTTITNAYGSLSGVLGDGQGGVYGITLGHDWSTHNEGAFFRWRPADGFALLHNVTSDAEGSLFQEPPAYGPDGALYGATYRGGVATDWGVVYRTTTGGQWSLLHEFTGGADGGFPSTGLVLAKDGYLYGTTTQGGGHSQGVVFRVHP